MKNLVISTTIIFSSLLFIGFTLPSNEMENIKDSFENNEYVPTTPPPPSISHNCGYAVLVRADPPSGVTYYWQSTSTGTSTANSSKVLQLTTGSPNGTVYYLRARDNSTGQWSSARSFMYYNNIRPGLAAPATPTVSEVCGSFTVTRANPPSGVTWYWQSSPTGTDTSNSSVSLTRTNNGAQFLRARDNNTGCWSLNFAQVNLLASTLPGAPPTPNVNNNCQNVVLSHNGSAPPNVTWYWQSTASGTSTANSNASITLTSGSIYFIRARNNNSGCWSLPRSVSYILPTMPDAATIAINCGNTVLTRNNPPTGITWYWQSSPSGTSTSESSISITRTSGGVYYLRARNNSTLCWSEARAVGYPIKHAPDAPPTPSIVNNCENTVLSHNGSAPSNTTWYWQSAGSGTSMANSSTSISLTSGSLYFIRARNNDNGCWSPPTSISYTINTLPDTPSSPTIDATCGATNIFAGTPPAGVTWFWQTSAAGTSTASVASSSSPKTITAGSPSGTIYLRARNNSTGCWSSSRTVNYTVKVVPSTPAIPSVLNHCGNTELKFNGSPPINTVWFWQSSANGTSTSNSSSSIILTSGNVYYLRAMSSNGSGCWSNAVTVNYSIQPLPPTPTTPTVTNNCGNSVLTRSNPPTGITWYWQSSASGTSTSNSSASITLTSGSVYYLRARNNSTLCWSPGVSVNYSIKSVPAIPDAATIAINCGSTILTRNNPPTGITWYWQSSPSGTSTSQSSVSITRTSGGVYYLRARNNSSLCWSEARAVGYTIKDAPDAPPTPNIDNNCENTVLSHNGSVPPNTTWYWQSAGGGTSTANSSASISLTSGSLYFIRARNNNNGCWSPPTSVSYTINTLPDIPSSPTIDPRCGATNIFAGTPPTGVTWFWQTSDTGTSTVSVASSSSPKTITAGNPNGTIYLRARDNSTGCWSENSRSVSYTIREIPGTPTAPSVSNNCGNSVLTRTNPPTGVTWYWQSSESGTDTSNSSTSITRTSGSTYYLRARHNSSACWSNAVTVNYDIQSIPGAPTIDAITKNCGNTVLRRNNPPNNDILWYWQSTSSGTSTSDSNVTITRTTGSTYYLRAKNNITNCWSEATQINYTINMQPEMPPVINVTYECDGTTLLSRATNPPSGETWYWQSSSEGTTTTDAGPSFPRSSGGYYYLRPRNNTTLCWGPARIVGYGIYPATEKPASPIVENNCGSTTLRHNGQAPMGVNWYWQSTPYGTSFDNPDDSITFTSGNTYYIRAYKNDTNCWSEARYIDYYIDQVERILPTGRKLCRVKNTFFLNLGNLKNQCNV